MNLYVKVVICLLSETWKNSKYDLWHSSEMIWGLTARQESIIVIVSLMYVERRFLYYTRRNHVDFVRGQFKDILFKN